MENFVLFSGTSNPDLARDVAKLLAVQLGKCEITRFPDGECRVYVKEDVKGKSIAILQSLSPDADRSLVELCLLASAARSLGAGAMTAVIPWLGYSKQDRAFRAGEANSSQIVAQLIQSAGFTNVIAVDLHSPKIPGYYTIPFTELSTRELFAHHISKNNSTCIVAPDAGGARRGERLTHAIGVPVVYVEKSRDKTDGTVKVIGLRGEVAGKDCIMVDDIINSGATAINVAEYLRSKSCTRITLYATHAVLVGEAVKQLSKSAIDEIIVTDTIALPQDKMFGKLRIVSVAPLIAQAIRVNML